MTPQDIALALSAKKSALTFTLVTRRAAKVFKNCGEQVEKESTIVGLFADYADLEPVATAVAAGERTAPELPSHIARSVNIGGVRFWEGHNGKFYLPVPLAEGGSSRWFLHHDEFGFQPAGYQDVEPFLLASEKPKPQDREALSEKGQAPFVAVSVENIVSASPN
jgi:hypothetical protein